MQHVGEVLGGVLAADGAHRGVADAVLVAQLAHGAAGGRDGRPIGTWNAETVERGADRWGGASTLTGDSFGGLGMSTEFDARLAQRAETRRARNRTQSLDSVTGRIGNYLNSYYMFFYGVYIRK